jgi:hypothetical protein
MEPRHDLDQDPADGQHPDAGIQVARPQLGELAPA